MNRYSVLVATLLCAACGESTPEPAPAEDVAASDPGATGDAPIPVVSKSLLVSSADARSCECLVTDPGRALAKVGFGPTVEGRWVRRGDRVGVAFMSRSDAAIEGGAVTLDVTGGAGALAVSRATCFDRQGAELSGASVTVQE